MPRESGDARRARLDRVLGMVHAHDFTTTALELLADGMGRVKRAIGEETYVTPDALVLAVCDLAFARWSSRASETMATHGLWSTTRIGELAHLVSEGFGLATGPETVADYSGCSTGSLLLPGRRPPRRL